MVSKRNPKVLIIGAGMAGITAAHTLHTSTRTAAFDIQVLEAGDRIGGRIHSSELASVRVQMGATWIHGITGSPIYEIARQTGALESDFSSPSEFMDGYPEDHVTVAEGGLVVDPAPDGSVQALYRALMDVVDSPSAKAVAEREEWEGASIGGFLRRGLERGRASLVPWGQQQGQGWSQEALKDALFAMHEHTLRTISAADELSVLDLAAFNEYQEFPGDEITIAKGYSRVVEHLASALPRGAIQLGKKVVRIEWRPSQPELPVGDDPVEMPVRVHFEDGSVDAADHVVVTVSLGVLKSTEMGKEQLFSPPLPEFKREAIGRLGFGTVNKLFMEYDGPKPVRSIQPFPALRLAFDQRKKPQAAEGGKERAIPRWMRRTARICPVYEGSSVLLAWFGGKEAAELEGLKEEDIVDGVNATLDAFHPAPAQPCCDVAGECDGGWPWCGRGRVRSIRRSGWSSNPLFCGSYSYVAVGSSGDDFDRMAQPLPHGAPDGTPQLQVLFAGEATHRTYYSTTHGAYLSAIREANRLLQHYRLVDS